MALKEKPVYTYPAVQTAIVTGCSDAIPSHTTDVLGRTQYVQDRREWKSSHTATRLDLLRPIP